MRWAIAIVALPLLLAGCAGSRFDRNFRSIVGQVDVTGENTYSDARTGVTDTAGGGVDFVMRDPSKESPAPTYAK